VLVSFKTIVESIGRDFVATLRDSCEISANSKWKALLTLIAIATLFVFALVLTDKTDRFHALRVANSVQAMERREKATVNVDKHCEARMASLCAAMLRRANASFPDIFNKDSMSEILISEMKRSHRWASLLFHHSSRRPRALRLLIIMSLVNCVLFLNALFFKVTSYDQDRSCEKNWFERMCTDEPSRFAPNDSKCYWDELHYRCHYKNPSSHLSALMLGLLAAALLSVPVMMAFELVVDEILVRPAASPSISLVSSRSVPVGPSPDSAEEVNGIDVDPFSNQDIREEEAALTGARQDLYHLASSLINYRDTLGLEDLQHFDRRWGFATPFYDYFGPPTLNIDMYLQHQNKENPRVVDMWSEGNEIPVKQHSALRSIADVVKKSIIGDNQFVIFDQIVEEIKLSRIHATREVRAMKGMTVRNKKKRLLQLFQMDLLVGMRGVIVAKLWSGGEPTHVRDRLMRPVSPWLKVSCYGFVAVSNAFFIVYVMIFCLGQDFAGQATFMKLFALWLAIEVVVISTLSTLFTRVLFPLCIAYWDAIKLKRDLRGIILDHFGFSNYSTKVSDHTPPDKTSVFIRDLSTTTLNVCPYIFVSHRVAAQYPELLESAVIEGFRSCYPKKAFTGPVGVSLRQRALYAVFSILHSGTVCIFYVAGLMLNTALGYQAASVVSWCLVGFIASLDSDVIHVTTARGVVFVFLLWGLIVYVVKDMLGRVNNALREQNELMILVRKKVPAIKKRDTESITSTKTRSPPLAKGVRAGRVFPLPSTRKIDSRSSQDQLLTHDNQTSTGSSIDPGIKLLGREVLPLPSVVSRQPEFVAMSPVEMMTALSLDLKQADLKLAQALIAEEGEDPDVFQPWSELSRSLIAMFDGVPFYVDDKGQRLSKMALATKLAQAEMSDPDRFQYEVKLTKRRQWRSKQWDEYRLFDSPNVLAFVDRHGHLFNEAAIRKRRTAMDPMLSEERTRSISKEVLHRLSVKHIVENNLLSFKESMGLTEGGVVTAS
jgi:hypothetical protein